MNRLANTNYRNKKPKVSDRDKGGTRMNIKYPDLVEDTFLRAQNKLPDITRDYVYQRLLDNNIIDELGNPTQNAIDDGLISYDVPFESRVQTYKKEVPQAKDIDISHFYIDQHDVLSLDDSALYKLGGNIIESGNGTRSEMEWAIMIMKYLQLKGGNQHGSNIAGVR